MTQEEVIKLENGVYHFFTSSGINFLGIVCSDEGNKWFVEVGEYPLSAAAGMSWDGITSVELLLTKGKYTNIITHVYSQNHIDALDTIRACLIAARGADCDDETLEKEMNEVSTKPSEYIAYIIDNLKKEQTYSQEQKDDLNGVREKIDTLIKERLKSCGKLI